MDAVEYEKGRRRMCRTNILKKGSCEGCDAYSVLMHRCDFVPPPPGRKADDEKVIKKNIATVEQWVKDNQIKTRQSEFLKMFPNKEQKRYIDRPMRLIDEREVMIAVFNAIEMDEDEYNAIKAEVDEIPTIDPESLRPTAHIMRGTVPDTHDDAFCSNCRSYLGVPGVDYEDYDSVLNHRYKYCPYCGARMVNEDE